MDTTHHQNYSIIYLNQTLTFFPLKKDYYIEERSKNEIDYEFINIKATDSRINNIKDLELKEELKYIKIFNLRVTR